MNMKIRTKLLLFLAILIVLPSAAIGISSFISAKNKVQENIVNSATSNVYLINDNINSTISSQFKLIELLSRTINKSSYEEDNLPTLLNQFQNFLETHKEVGASYVGTEDGNTYIYPKVELPAGFDPRTRDWYKQAKDKNGEVIITSPYVDVATNSLIVSIAKELPDGSGVVALDISLNELKKLILNVKIGKTGYPAMLDQNNLAIIHPSIKPGKTLPKEISEKIKTKGDFAYTYKGASKQLVYSTNKLTGWKILGTIDQQEFMDEAMPILISTGIIVVAFLLIGAMISFYIIRMIMKPINELISVTEKVSTGNLTVKVPIASNDEFGILGKAFNKMIDSLIQLISKLNLTSNKLAKSSEELAVTITQVSEITSNVNQSMVEMAAGAEVQMTSTNESSIATEEIASGVQYVAEKLSEASESSTEATSNVDEGNIYIHQGITEMKNIHETVKNNSVLVQQLGKKSSEINVIIDVIKGISEQTNLLALNASIEAARAGEYGKGFSVVAQEIRKLAEASKKSTSEISEILSSIQGETSILINAMELEEQQTLKGLEAITQTGESFTKILHSITEVNKQIQEVSATSEEISASTEEISASFNEISNIATSSFNSTKSTATDTKEQLKMTEETSIVVSELAKLAMELKDEIASFKIVQ
jgi:methyl-accepting chemotaxis protein